MTDRPTHWGDVPLGTGSTAPAALLRQFLSNELPDSRQMVEHLFRQHRAQRASTVFAMMRRRRAFLERAADA